MPAIHFLCTVCRLDSSSSLEALPRGILRKMRKGMKHLGSHPGRHFGFFRCLGHRGCLAALLWFARAALEGFVGTISPCKTPVGG